MKEETTKLLWSEDLWAQVRRAAPKVRTQRRGAWQADARLEGYSKRMVSRRDGRGSDLRAGYDSGRL
jgi:hypothetical protein